MNSRALALELLDAAENGMVETLRAIGVTSRGAINTGLYVGRQRVQPLSCGLYEPDPTGPEAIIIPAVEPSGAVIDLVAFCADQPGQWWQRTGTATALGEKAIERADYLEEPLDLYPDPLGWLRAECRGATILDPGAAGWVLAGLKTVTPRGPDLAFALDLERWLKRPVTLPSIRVPELV